jgi:hypothetical protein
MLVSSKQNMEQFPPGRSIENAKSYHLTLVVCFSFRRIKQIINDTIWPAVRTCNAGGIW